eukprot:TRINITY_DN35245_c0_g1_i1.p1 TRINITY_DN35245_c0_g1~~TRINITY_DN35245_c0_g1_i1.p1  ORF type:complete len:277 (-),score=69.91 TRINITY_DN35245_c0_g1_i1:126-956(-)
MDRTADFRRLAGLSGTGTSPFKPSSSFMLAIEAQGHRLAELCAAQQRGEASPSDIHACQAEMSQLEEMAEDLTDLGKRAPAPGQRKDQVAHRRGAVAGLYEELQKLAEKVQKEQVTEMQREAEVAGFFTAGSSSSRLPKLKPPPALPTMEELASWSSGGGRDADTADSASLRAEEQRLISTFTTDLDKIQETRTKIEEVSAMVGLFATKVAEQTEQVEEIHQLAEESTAHIESAKKHLDKAASNQNGYRFYVVCWFIGSSLFLLVFDYIDANYSLI